MDVSPRFSSRVLRLEDCTRQVQSCVGREIRGLAVSSKCFYVSYLGERLLRYYPDEKEVTEISFEKNAQQLGEVGLVFCDSKGFHCLVSTSTGDTWYVNSESSKAVFITRLKKHFVSAVAWGTEGTLEGTGRILLGTQQGSILELIVDNEQVCECRQLFHVPGEDGICTILWHKGIKQEVVICVTKNCLYEFKGATYDKIFTSEVVSKKQLPMPLESLRFELFSTFPSSQLLIESPAACENAQLLFWLTSQGILTTVVNLNDEKVFTEKPRVIVAPDVTATDESSLFRTDSRTSENTYAKAMLVTDFHLVVMYEEQVKLFSLIDYSVVFAKIFPRVKCGSLRGLVKDPYDGSLWLYSDLYIYELIIADEASNAWRSFLLKNKFSSALSYAETSDQKETVLCAEADYLFQHGNYEGAAKCYAFTKSLCFEDICLKFITKKREKALLIFLKHKYITIRKNQDGDNMTIQLVLLYVWVLELLADRVGQYEGLNVAKHEEALKELSDWLKQMNDNNVPEMETSVYSLLYETNQSDSIIEYAVRRRDLKSVVLQYISLQRCAKAVNVMVHAFAANEDVVPTLEAHGRTLFYYAPQEMIEFLTIAAEKNGFEILLPILMQAATCHKKTAKTFLDTYLLKNDHHLAKKNNTNFMKFERLWCLNLYLQNDEEETSKFLRNSTCLIKQDFNYAQYFAIRHLQSQVNSKMILYGLIGMSEHAVLLALNANDLELAKQTAETVAEPASLKKRLYTIIANYLIKSNHSPQTLLALIRETHGLLHIREFLPYLTDSSIIDTFKDEICDSLEYYQNRISSTVKEIKLHMNTAETLKKDLTAMKRRCIVVSLNKTCDQCHTLLFTEKFFAFPCGHAFHYSCSQRLYLPTLNIEERENYNAHLDALKEAVNCNKIDSEIHRSEKALDSLIAGDCFICGTAMRRAIVEPLIPEHEERESWEIRA